MLYKYGKMIQQTNNDFVQRIYPAAPPVPNDAGLHLTQMGRLESRGTFAWEQTASFVSLHAILEGKGAVTCNGTTQPAEAGDLFFFRPEQHYRYSDSKRHPWKYVYVAFGGPFAVRMFREAGIPDQQTVLSIPFGTTFWITLKNLCGRFEAGDMNGAAAVRAAWEMFEQLFRHSRQGASHSGCSTAETARQLIESSPQALTSVNDLAEALNISRVTLFRLFRKRYNMSIKDFMEQVRFERIQRLLTETDLPIGQIARFGGFSDPLYFSRAFRKRFELSPSEWRRSRI